ncbi:membrane protein [Aeromonas finlandensis]|uniref:COG4705 family protein n=1 Tax=Aeromonas finlandensis TaxID=1543375 RepID=UPI00051BE36E|nr:membrane protein [Aeromonas finlandensis]
MHNNTSSAVSKVPELTLAFWVIKILATTLGETGGDAVSMSMDLGYLVSTGIFAVIFFVAVSAQISVKTYNPTLYWATIIATTTVGTTLADFADRSLGIGYAGGSTILVLLLLGSFAVWYRAQGEISSSVISSPRTEMFYWITIMFSQTLGTALGDWTADDAGFGYAGSSVVFGGILLAIVATYLLTNISRTFLFWAAFIITRPLGAVVGDFLDKPISKGGLELSRYSASVALLVAIAALVYISTLKSKRNDPVELDLDSEG